MAIVVIVIVAIIIGVGALIGMQLPELRRYLSDYLEVPSIMDEEDVIARVHGWLRGRSVDRVLANWEPLVITAARLRRQERRSTSRSRSSTPARWSSFCGRRGIPRGSPRRCARR